MSNIKQFHYVYVLDRKGNPLPPTKRCRHVRKLLEEGKAVPVKNNPFTIRLKYDVEYEKDQFCGYGQDPGRENPGEASSVEDGACVYLSDIRTNNKSIKSNMADRADSRRDRRRHDRQNKQRKAVHDDTEIQNGKDDVCRTKITCKSKEVSYPGAENPVTHKIIQGKEGKFNNRKREEGWQTPSGRQLIQMHMRALENACKILPVTDFFLERNAFDFQRLENEDIKRWEYGKGPLYGYKSYKDYIWDAQHGKCLLCDKNKIDYYHHINPQKDGKYDHVSNIAGLCHECHYGRHGVHNSQEAEDALRELKKGTTQKYSVGLLNSIMPELIERASAFCKEKGIKFHITDGKITKETREKYDLPKDHCIDAYAISLAGREDVANISLPDVIHMQRRFKKKSGNNIAALNKREYWFEGKCVAKNRHKATDQKEDSLEEYMEEYAKTHTEKECRRHIHELDIHPAKRTYTYHKEGLVAPIKPGDVVVYEKKNKVKGNTKREVFVATGVEYTEVVRSRKGVKWTEREWKVSFGDGNKTRKAKFCRPVGSGCLQCIETVPTAAYLEKVQSNAVKFKQKKKKKKNTINKVV